MSPRHTEAKKRAILAQYQAGALLREIGDRHGVTSGYVVHLARAKGVPLRKDLREPKPKSCLQTKLDRLDAPALACFDRCRRGDMSFQMAYAIALDDMDIRARVAARKAVQ